MIQLHQVEIAQFNIFLIDLARKSELYFTSIYCSLSDVLFRDNWLKHRTKQALYFFNCVVSLIGQKNLGSSSFI